MTFTINQLRPVRDFALRYGVKSLVHGAAGTGKTPILSTAPLPLLLAVEPGLTSMRKFDIPTCRAENADQCDEFFKWFFGSNERRQFQTFSIDSISELSSQYLWRAQRLKRDGRAAYGLMAEQLIGDPQNMGWLRKLFYAEACHTYLIAKQGVMETSDDAVPPNVTRKLVPAFEGQKLLTDVPHLYDLIMHLGNYIVPDVGMTRAFCTKGNNSVLARDRSGLLADYEPPNLAYIFNKAMQ